MEPLEQKVLAEKTRIVERIMKRELHPNFATAESDTVLIITFVGDMPEHGDIYMENISPGQLVAVGEFLKMKGLQMWQQREMQAVQEQRNKAEREKALGIKTTNQMPPGDSGFVGPMGDITG